MVRGTEELRRKNPNINPVVTLKLSSPKSISVLLFFMLIGSFNVLRAVLRRGLRPINSISNVTEIKPIGLGLTMESWQAHYHP